MTAQIIEIAGQKMAVMPVAEYQRLCDAVEDAADVASFDAAMLRREEGEECLPGAMVDRLLAGENALCVWREHKELTMAALAEKSGVPETTISELESGQAFGTPLVWRALADALAVMADDILPLR